MKAKINSNQWFELTVKTPVVSGNVICTADQPERWDRKDENH
jgi:hypothetical protein